MKYNDEELSLLLGEHDCEQLCVTGWDEWNLDNTKSWTWLGPRGCINQCIHNEPDTKKAFRKDHKTAEKFDNEYFKYWTSKMFLRWLEKL